MSAYSIEVKKNGGSRTVFFSGNLVINHIDKMTKEVKEKLKEPADTVVEIANPDNVDMTFLQLVIAIRHSCIKAGKKFEVKTTLKDDLKDLIVKAGLERELNI